MCKLWLKLIQFEQPKNLTELAWHTAEIIQIYRKHNDM